MAVVGATGLVGRHLVDALRARGDEPVAVSRAGAPVDGALAVRWSPGAEPLPAAALEGAEAIVNLAGAPLTAGRWSHATQAAIRESRVTTTRGVVAAVASGGPRVLVNASAIGYYGATDDAVDESSPAGDDFLASVCVEWEREALAAAASGARVVVARSGIVLARDGGALPRLLRLARLGVLGAIGSGAQWVPFVHVRDEVGALLHALDVEQVAGPMNVVAPLPVRQRAFAAALRQAVHRPAAPTLPAAVVRAAMGAASALVLTGQRAVPAVLDATGYRFAFPTLEAALAELVAG